MQWFKNTFYFLIVAVLIIIIIFQRGCSSTLTPIDGGQIIKIETKYDTIRDTTIVYVPKWSTRTITIRDSFSVPIDTLAILEDYFASYYYQDSLTTDSVKFYINDTISENRVKSRILSYSLIYPTTTITTIKTQNKREIYVGFGVIGGSKSLNYIGPELLYRTKKGTAYNLGIGTNSELSPLLRIGTYWKL